MALLQKVAKVLLTLSCCLSTYADAGNRQINLTLHSFTEAKINGENGTAQNTADKTANSDKKSSNTASQASQTSQSMQPSLTLNRVSQSPVSQSKAKFNLQDLVAVSLDEHGNELSRQIIKNPLYFRAEVFDEGTGAMTFSKDIKRPSAVLNLILPDDNKLHSVKIYQPIQEKNQLVLQQLDEITLELPQAQAAMSDSLNSKAMSQNSASSNVIRVLDNGDSTNRVDLVFLSEGYTNYQLAQFSTDVNNIINGYFDVPPYKEYKNLYNDIALRIYEKKGHLKYDFILKAGAENNIQINYQGQNNISINEKGELVIATTLGQVIEEKPYAYQIINGKEIKVKCNFQLKNNALSFSLGKYNK